MSDQTLSERWLSDFLQSEKFDIKVPARGTRVKQDLQNYLSTRFTFSDFGMLYSPYLLTQAIYSHVWSNLEWKVTQWLSSKWKNWYKSARSSWSSETGSPKLLKYEIHIFWLWHALQPICLKAGYLLASVIQPWVKSDSLSLFKVKNMI